MDSIIALVKSGKGFAQIATDEQYKQVEKMLDQCYNFHEPELAEKPRRPTRREITKQVLMKMC